jgi:hypothetical protein
MSSTTPPGTAEPDDERPPLMQRVLDDPFLLLFIGVTIPTVLYILWGVMEVASVPLAK